MFVVDSGLKWFCGCGETLMDVSQRAEITKKNGAARWRCSQWSSETPIFCSVFSCLFSFCEFLLACFSGVHGGTLSKKYLQSLAHPVSPRNTAPLPKCLWRCMPRCWCELISWVSCVDLVLFWRGVVVVLFMLSCSQGLGQHFIVFSLSPCHVLVLVRVLCLLCRLYFGFVDLVVVRLGVFHLQCLIRESFLLLLLLLLWSSSRYVAHNFVVNSFCFFNIFSPLPYDYSISYLLNISKNNVIIFTSSLFHVLFPVGRFLSVLVCWLNCSMRCWHLELWHRFFILFWLWSSSSHYLAE